MSKLTLIVHWKKEKNNLLIDIAFPGDVNIEEEEEKVENVNPRVGTTPCQTFPNDTSLDRIPPMNLLKPGDEVLKIEEGQPSNIDMASQHSASIDGQFEMSPGPEMSANPRSIYETRELKKCPTSKVTLH